MKNWKGTLNSTYNEVSLNGKSAIMKENHTKYFPFTYNDVALNKKPLIMKEYHCIFVFIKGGVECSFSSQNSTSTLTLITG